MGTTRSGLAGLAMAMVLVLAACGSSSDDADVGADATTTTAAEAEATTTTAAAAEDDAEADDEVATESAEPAEPAVFDPDATPLLDPFVPLEPGTYRVDTVGTPMSFTVEEDLFIQPNGEAFFVVTNPFSQGPDDRDIVFLRLSGLADPTQPNASLEDQGDGWPVDDFSGWIDNLSDDVVVSNRETTTLGGLDAERVDLQLAEGTVCSDEDDFCVGFGHNRFVNGKSLEPGSQYRIWVVDQEDEAPLAVIVAIRRESQTDWFETADSVLTTLAFGDVAPNPIPSEGDLWTLGFSAEAPAGVVELPGLGGISIELAEPTFSAKFAEGFYGLALEGQPADTEFLQIAGDVEGNPLTTVDAAVALFAGDVGGSLTELDSTTVGGLDARVFDVTSITQPDVFAVREGMDRGWRPPLQGRLWLIEHPDRGLLMITAEAFDRVATVFPLVLARTEAIVESLEFIDLG